MHFIFKHYFCILTTTVYSYMQTFTYINKTGVFHTFHIYCIQRCMYMYIYISVNRLKSWQTLGHSCSNILDTSTLHMTTSYFASSAYRLYARLQGT